MNNGLSFTAIDFETAQGKRNSICQVGFTYNIELDHHHALSDALACAKLFLMHLQTEAVS